MPFKFVMEKKNCVSMKLEAFASNNIKKIIYQEYVTKNTTYLIAGQLNEHVLILCNLVRKCMSIKKHNIYCQNWKKKK